MVIYRCNSGKVTVTVKWPVTNVVTRDHLFLFRLFTGDPNAVLVIYNLKKKMVFIFTCVPVFFIYRFGGDLNQSEGGLRCEF